MGDDEEVEGFHVSERDLSDAFQPGQRRFRKLTKNQHIYGVFDEGDDFHPSASINEQSKTGRVQNRDYSAPVDFVKGGVHQNSKERNASTNDVHKLNEKSEVKQLDTQAGQTGESSTHQFSSKRYYKSKTTSGSDVGMWEKHTKGIGAKLLMKMGYQPGKGLGKSLQGRSEPVEAQVRKGRGAVGMYGSEFKNEAVAKSSLTIDEDEEEERKYFQKLNNWRKDITEPTSSKKQKVQYVYRTPEDVIEEMNKNNSVHKMAREYSEISKAKVIDMTGKEKRVLLGYSALKSKKTEEPTEDDSSGLIKGNSFQLDKLSFNLDTLVDYCEHEIIQNAKELSQQKEQISAMEEQMNNMKIGISKESGSITMLTSMLDILEHLENQFEENSLDLDFLWQEIKNVERSYPEQYLSFDLANVALTYLIPLIKQRMSSSWRPFDSKSSDDTCRSIFQRWRPLLEFHVPTTSRSKINRAEIEHRMDPFHALLWHAWMPAFRGLVGQWSCKDADPMVDLLDSWETILPSWIVENIVDLLILPRIQNEVDNWNPLTDLIPIHAWIHPWLPRLGSKLEIVYPSIRQKMAQALVSWTPSDQSARSVLLPWVPVFSKGAMDAFLVKNILPKLQSALMNWEINPSRQSLDVWHWVMNWKDLMPLHSLVQLLVSCFFPKWLQVLVTWLNHHPNYEEIVVWYTGWKALFPADVAQNPAIEDQFTRALDLMNRSLAVGGQVDYNPATRVVIPVIPAPPIVEPTVPHGFRELIEYRCAQQGVVFLPVVNRFHGGRQIFRVGNLHCYFDRQVVFVLLNNVWTPVTAQQLLDIALA